MKKAITVGIGIILLSASLAVVSGVRAAELLGYHADDGRIWHVFNHNGQILHCVNPGGGYVAVCLTENGTEIKCEATSPANGYLISCGTPI